MPTKPFLAYLDCFLYTKKGLVVPIFLEKVSREV